MLSVLIALASAGAPSAEARPDTSTFHGTEVADPYRWLEDWEDPAVVAWSEGQNAHARETLDALPNRDAIGTRLDEIMSATTVSWWGLEVRGERAFSMKREPPRQQPFLVVMGSDLDPTQATVLLDPAVRDHSVSLDWFVPSPDGSLVAVSLSKGGSESGDVHIIDVTTGDEVHEVVPRVNGGTAGGDLVWTADGTGFFYTRYPAAGEVPDADLAFYQQVWFHTLGDAPADDRYELGKGFARIAEIQLQIHHGTGQVLATVQHGDGGEFDHYVRSSDGAWDHLVGRADRVVELGWGPEGDLFGVSLADTPRGKVVHIASAADGLKSAKVLIEQGDDAVMWGFWGGPKTTVTPSRLYVGYQLGGPSQYRVFDHAGKPMDAPEQPEVGSVGRPTVLDGEVVAFSASSYVEPGALYRFDAEAGTTEKTALFSESPVDYSAYEITREMAVSKDGTKVPVNILHRRGLVLDGSHPALVTGYGGYGVNLSPGFSARRVAMLEQGVVMAVANLRGGSEFGQDWHQQGRLTNKQNVFDDLDGVLSHMVERGYTSRARLAIEGGSNGGLLMGAQLTQHPDSVATVVSHVGIYDMLRVELSPNGSFNIPEFGTVEDPAQFAALHAYSPYHHVTDGTAYPPTLLLTGANDPRVDPMQSRKMTARMQAASPGSVLLRTSANSGHGNAMPLDARLAKAVDVHAFIFHHLGVDYTDPDAAVAAELPAADSGCGCSAVGAPAAVLWPLGLLVAVGRRRRS
jgi:prolyl oligopeptidase